MSDWDFPQKYSAYITYDLSSTGTSLYASSFEEAAEQFLKYLDSSANFDEINNSSGEHITVTLELESKDFYVKRKFIPTYEVLSND